MGAHQGLTPHGPSGPTRLFFDGGCGLCHAAVRFVARRDAAGRVRFAPLEGPTFRRLVPGWTEPGASLVVLPEGGAPLVRSEAVLHLLTTLGGPWARLARLAGALPRPLRDGLYALVARHRHRCFRRPEGPCPVLPPGLGARVDP